MIDLSAWSFLLSSSLSDAIRCCIWFSALHRLLSTSNMVNYSADINKTVLNRMHTSAMPLWNRYSIVATHTHTTVSWPLVWDYPGRLVPGETFSALEVFYKWYALYKSTFYLLTYLHSPTHTHPDHASFINFQVHLVRCIASSLFNLHAWQSFSTTSVQVLFGLHLGLGPSTSYSMHFFTQSSSSFHNACPYHRSPFCCNTNVMSSIPNLSLSSLLENLYFSLTLHIQKIHLCTLNHFTQIYTDYHTNRLLYYLQYTHDHFQLHSDLYYSPNFSFKIYP